MLRIEFEGQLGWLCYLKRHGNLIVTPFSTKNQLAIHDITRQIGTGSCNNCICEPQLSQSSHPNKRMASTPAKVPTKAATKLPIIFGKTFDGPGVLIASWHNAPQQRLRARRVICRQDGRAESAACGG